MVLPGAPGRWALGSSQTRPHGSQSLERPGCFSVVGGSAGNHQGHRLVGSLLTRHQRGPETTGLENSVHGTFSLEHEGKPRIQSTKTFFLLQSRGQTGYMHLKAVINTRPTNDNLGGLICNLPSPRYFNSTLQGSKCQLAADRPRSGFSSKQHCLGKAQSKTDSSACV